jgi:hypothetical protein
MVHFMASTVLLETLLLASTGMVASQGLRSSELPVKEVMPATFLPGLKLEMLLTESRLKAFFTGLDKDATRIREELKRLKKLQERDLSALKHSGPEDEAALMATEVMNLRRLAKDEQFADSYRVFLRETGSLLEKYAEKRADQRDRDWRMAAFQAESLSHVPSFPDLSMYRVEIPNGSHGAFQQFLAEFQPVLDGMNQGLFDHCSRMKAAESAALLVTRSKVVPVAARAIRVRDYQVLLSILETLKWAYVRLLI